MLCGMLSRMQASPQYLLVAHLPLVVTTKHVGRHSQMSPGREGLPPIENHSCCSPASQILSELLSSHPDPVLAQLGITESVCQIQTQMSLKHPVSLKPWITYNALPPGTCCLKSHVTSPVCVLNLLSPTVLWLRSV